MEEQFSIPVYASELIDQLDETFPHRCPRMEESERSIFHYAGMRELVDFLKAKRDEEEHDKFDPSEDIISNVRRNT